MPFVPIESPRYTESLIFLVGADAAQCVRKRYIINQDWMLAMAKIVLDAIDRRILDNLQRNGRLSNIELAERAGLSPSPCLRRVRNLEEAGIIKGYAAVLDRKKIGLGMTVFILMKREWQSDAEATAFREQVAAMPEVIACHTTSGEHDFLIEAVVPDLDEYRLFSLERVMKMSGVKDIRSSFAIEAVKENGPLPLRHVG